MNIKYNILDLKTYAKENFQGDCLSSFYKSNKDKYEWLCSKGHKWFSNWNNIYKGNRCPECYGNKKYTLEYVKKFLEDNNFQLLTKEYKWTGSKLDVICPKGHRSFNTFKELKLALRCAECAGVKKHSFEFIKHFYKTRGYELLSEKYINVSSKLKIKCNKHHIFETTYYISKKGFGCPECSGNKKYTIEEVKEYIETQKYQLISNKYKNNRSKLDMICDVGHKIKMTYYAFKYEESRCISCSHQTSKAEQEILTFTQQYYPSSSKIKFRDLILNCPTEYKNKELDIYIPQLRLAIEYCGLYWHSDLSGKKSTKHHTNKLKWCNDNNIRLITIFEDEWLNRKEQTKNFLLSVLNVYTIKLGARQCIVFPIDNKEAIKFIDTYHIQPIARCKFSFGLYYNKELIGIITGSKHHRNNESIILQRMCFKTGYQIAGGASKLFSVFKKEAKLYSNSIISWSDNRISEGNVYNKMGFILFKNLPPDYSYVKHGVYNRFSKQSLKKTKEEQALNKTESMLRTEQGYYKIWDCGKKTWIFNNL